MGRVVGGRGHLPLRPLEDARGDLRDRHAAAHGERVAAHRPRDVVHAHRPRGALPAHAWRRGLLPDGLGRQRPAHRAARAELLRRALRPVAACRPRLRRLHAGAARRRPRRGQPAELHRALRAAHGRGREGVRGAVPAARAVGRLAADVHDDRRGVAPRVAARVPAARAQRDRVHGRGAHDVGRRLPHGGRPGRDRGPRDRGHLPPGRVRPGGRQRPDRDRDVAARADPGVRRARGEPRRRAVRTARRGDRAHAGVPRAGAGGRARARRPREGNGRGADLHVRRRHRRRLVARPRAAGPGGRAPRRHARRRPVRRARVGVARRRCGERRDGAARGQGREAGAEADRRAAPRGRLARRRAGARAARREVLREGGPPARGHLEPPVVREDARAQGRAARARAADRVAPGVHGRAVRELGRGAEPGLGGQPAAVLRRAVPRVVPARRRRRADLRRADPARGSRAADRSAGRRAARLHGRAARRAGRVRRRPRRDGHVGDVVALAPDRRAVGGRPRPVRAALPDGPATAGARHHPHLALLHGAARPPRARLAAVDERGDQRVRARPRPQEDVEVQGQRRRADRGLRAALGRRRALLGGERAPRLRRRDRRAADEGRPPARDQDPQRLAVRAVDGGRARRGHRAARPRDAGHALVGGERGHRRARRLRAREGARRRRAVLLGVHRRLPRAREAARLRRARPRGGSLGDRRPARRARRAAAAVRAVPALRDRGGLVVVARGVGAPRVVADRRRGGGAGRADCDPRSTRWPPRCSRPCARRRRSRRCR